MYKSTKYVLSCGSVQLYIHTTVLNCDGTKNRLVYEFKLSAVSSTTHSECNNQLNCLWLIIVKNSYLTTIQNPNKLIVPRGGVKFESVRNLFDSIRKFAIRLIRKGKQFSKKSMKINSKLVRFDSTPTIGWTQIFKNWIRSKFVRFDFKIFSSIYSKGNNSKNSIRINSKLIRFDLTSPQEQSSDFVENEAVCQ